MSRRARRLLAALGVFAAALVAGTSATVGFGLATGFERSASRAGLPDVIARFDDGAAADVDRRVGALPNLEARSYRYDVRDIRLRFGSQSTRKGILGVLGGGRRGYAVTEGRDVRAPGEVVIERGLARDWDLGPGDRLELGRRFELPVVGVAVAPDNVAFPLTVTPRVWLLPRGRLDEVNVAQLWLADPGRADITLAQARATSFGIGSLEFVTREGIRVLLGQAAGIVISLLVAFSLVALLAAGTMLATGAQADVARRLPAFGVQRALGYSPGRLAARQAAEAAAIAVPAASLGLAAGALAVSGPSGELLAQLNEAPPGWALAPVLALCLVGVVLVVCVAATWPAYRAARRPPAEILRGGDLRPLKRRRGPAGPAAQGAIDVREGERPGRTRSPTLPPLTSASSTAGSRTFGPAAGTAARPTSRLGDGLLATGARFALAARGRWLASVATIAVCAGVVTLMLALAALLERLRDDPGTVGKRYELTARLDPVFIASVRGIDGVAAASPRYQAEVADSYRLGEPLRLIAFPGDHTRFEAPPLASGRRLRGPDEAEVGLGLADALGLRPGSTLAVQAESGAEVRFRVVGVVRALEVDGRLAYVQPDRLFEADATTSATIAIDLDRDADRAAVQRELVALGARVQRPGAATTRNAAFLGVLASVLRGVGLAVGLVCLYALIQALAMTARERRGAVALLRACGADARTVAAVFAGAALVVAVPAAIAGLLLEWLAFGPLVARLAAGYAALPLAPTFGQVALVLGGLVLLAAGATALVARRALREPVVAGLREE